MKKVKITALLLALAGAYTASATDEFTGPYIGAGLGYLSASTSNVSVSYFTLHSMAGYASNINDKLVGFSELGILSSLSSSASVTGLPNNINIDSRIFAASLSGGIGYRMSDKHLIYTKGVLQHTSSKANVGNQSVSGSDLNFGLGLGTKYAITEKTHIGLEGQVLFNDATAYGFVLSVGRHF